MQVVSGSADKTVQVWNVSTGAELKVLKAHNTNYISSVAFSMDNMQIDMVLMTIGCGCGMY